MKISSPAFDDNQTIPEAYTCRGRGDVPTLEFGSVPSEAVSLALIVDDPDASNKTFVHFVVWNIPSITASLSGDLPVGAIEGVNSVGQVGFFAPCPPSGTHHYHFKLYALDQKLSLDESASKDELLKAMDGHILAETEMIGTVLAPK